MFPTIHLNGTSARDLADKYKEAAEAIYRAKAALQASAPHGRDYYPQGEHALMLAMSEHDERFRALDKVYKELQQLAEQALMRLK